MGWERWERCHWGGSGEGLDKVLGSMGDSVSGRNGRQFAVVREEFGGSSDADAFGFRDVEFVASIVVHGWPNIPCFLAMGCPALSCLGIFKDESSGSWRGQGRLVVIE